MTTVLCVPQWQGSAAPGASRLVGGAWRAAELVGADALVAVPVMEEGGGKREGVLALDVLVENLRLTREMLAGIDDMVITVGGDCGVDLGPIGAARREYGDDLTVLWFDAHPDSYTGQTLASGAFHGMVVRTLLGEGPAELVPDEPLVPQQIVLAGVRTGDPVEFDYIEKVGIRTIGVDRLESVLDGLSGPVYVHIDLDVLEPEEFGSVCYPEANGVRPERLIELVSTLDNMVGVGITEHAPAGDIPGEAEIIRELGSALVR